jgi:hypothetical protein
MGTSERRFYQMQRDEQLRLLAYELVREAEERRPIVRAGA